MGRSAAISTVERSNLAAVAYLGSGCDIGFHQHDRLLLEFVAGPQCPVIEVAACLTLFDKLARVKNSVVGLKPDVPIRLPPHFEARTMPDEACVALSRRNNQKSGDEVHSISQALPPLKDPIDGDSYTLRQRRFNARVRVDKVDGAGSSRGENAKIIALRKQRIECAEGVRPRIVATRGFRLSAESRFQRNVRKPITGFRSHCPGAYVCGTEGPELPKRFIVEIPAGVHLGDGTRKTRTDTVPHFVAYTPVECSCFSIEAKIVSVQCDGLRQRSDAVYTPKSDSMIGGIVEDARLVLVRAHGEAVNLPRADTGLYLEAVKAQAHVGALANIDQAPRAIFQLVSPGSELDPVAFIPCSDFEKCYLEIEFFFVDRSRTTDAIRIETTFEFHERANVLAIMKIEIKHVPFIEIAVHERLLAPVVVSDLFPNLASFAAHGQEPIIPTGSQANIFDGVPKLLPLNRISEKTPIVVFAKQEIGRAHV